MRPIILCELLIVLITVGCKERSEMAPTARLHWAARNGDVALVQSLIAGGCDVDAKDEHGGTPLSTAAAFGQMQVVEFLISKDADVNAKMSTGHTPLDVAHSVDVAQLLIDAGAEIGRRALYVDAGWRDKGVVELLLAKGAQIDPSLTTDNERLLCFAAQYGMRDLAEKLLAAGTNANVMDAGRTGMSALTAAVRNGNREMVMLLIAHGADVNKADYFYFRPLNYATYMNRDVIELLLANGADVNAGMPLHTAVLRGDEVIVELLLAHGADVNARSANGTPLDEALAGGDADVAEILRRHGAKE